MRCVAMALAGGLLFLGQPAYCQEKPAKIRTTRVKAKGGALVQIKKWPVFRGATVVREIDLSGDQMASLNGDMPPEARKQLKTMGGVQVLGLRLPGEADPAQVLAFYEPHALGAGYRLMVKDLEDPKEPSAVYTAPGGGVLVLSIQNDEADRLPVLEIVSVQGGLGNLAALGSLGDLSRMAPPRPAKIAPPPGPKPPSSSKFPAPPKPPVAPAPAKIAPPVKVAPPAQPAPPPAPEKAPEAVEAALAV